MRFTPEQQQKIRNEQQAAHNNHMDEMVAALKQMFEAIPAVRIEERVSKEEEAYRAFAVSVNQYLENVITVLNSKNTNAERDNQLNRYFDLEVKKQPGVTTFKDLLDLCELMMAENKGRAISNTMFKSAVETIRRIESVKNFYTVKQALDRAEDEAIVVANMSEKMTSQSNELKAYVDEMKRNFGNRFDFSDLEFALAQQKDKYAEAQDAYIAAVVALDETVKNDDDVVALIDDHSKITKVLVDVNNDKDELQSMSSQLDQITYVIEGMKQQIADRKKEIRALEVQRQNELDRIAKTKNLIDEKRNIIKDRKKMETEKFTEMNFDSKLQGYLARAIELDNESDEKKELLQMLDNRDVAACASALLISYHGKSDDDLVQHLESETARLGGDPKNSFAKEQPIYKNMHAARTLIETLYFEKDMSIEEIKKNITNGKDVAFTAALSNEIAENEVKKAELLMKIPKSVNLNVEAILKQFKENGKTIAQEQASIEQLKRQQKSYENRLKNCIVACEANANKMEDNNLAKTIVDTFDQLAELGQKETIKSYNSRQAVKTFAKLDKTVKIKNKKGEISTYERLIGELEQFKGIIAKDINAKKKADEGIVNLSQNNLKKIDDTLQTIKEDVRNRNNDHVLRTGFAMNAADSKVAAITLAMEKQDGFMRKHNELMQDIQEANGIASEVVSDMEAEFSKQILSTLLTQYHSLNDARVWKSNSPEYIAMIRPLCAVLHLPEPDYNTPVKDAQIDLESFRMTTQTIEQSLNQMKVAAQAYIESKGTRSFGTRQRDQRLSFAKQLINMCNDSKKQIQLINHFKQEKLKNPIDAYKKKAQEYQTVDQSLSKEEGQEKRSFGRMLNRMAQIKKKDAVEVKEEKVVENKQEKVQKIVK